MFTWLCVVIKSRCVISVSKKYSIADAAWLALLRDYCSWKSCIGPFKSMIVCLSEMSPYSACHRCPIRCLLQMPQYKACHWWVYILLSTYVSTPCQPHLPPYCAYQSNQCLHSNHKWPCRAHPVLVTYIGLFVCVWHAALTYSCQYRVSMKGYGRIGHNSHSCFPGNRNVSSGSTNRTFRTYNQNWYTLMGMSLCSTWSWYRKYFKSHTVALFKRRIKFGEMTK